VTPDQAGSSSQSSQPAGTTAESQATQMHYQPRAGAYPYAVGAWGYHYPQVPTPTIPPSATGAGVTQGDSVANVTTSGTFPYPYTPAQYTPGQPAYVPPIKYPYGAPANPAVSTPAASSSSSAGTKPTSSTAAQTQEQAYNSFLWKQPYTGPRDSTAPAEEPQAQSESTLSDDAPESTRKTDEVLTSTTNNDDIVPPTEVAPTDNPAPTSSIEGVTALKSQT
jgi:hypothetical protein